VDAAVHGPLHDTRSILNYGVKEIEAGVSPATAPIVSKLEVAGSKRDSLGERWADLFDPPDRAAFVKLPLLAYEGRRNTGKYPDVVIEGFLADDRCDHTGDASEFNMHHIVDRLPAGTADCERNFTRVFDGEMNKPRFLRWRNKRNLVSEADGSTFMSKFGGKPLATSSGRSR
jgi:hypothetical protein